MTTTAGTTAGTPAGTTASATAGTTGSRQDGPVPPLLHPRLADLDPVVRGERGGRSARAGRLRVALGTLGTCLAIILGLHTTGAPALGAVQTGEATRQTQSSPSAPHLPA